jgi:hypothetical protein
VKTAPLTSKFSVAGRRYAYSRGLQPLARVVDATRQRLPGDTESSATPRFEMMVKAWFW